jgi:hypothetical protein
VKDLGGFSSSGFFMSDRTRRIVAVFRMDRQKIVSEKAWKKCALVIQAWNSLLLSPPQQYPQPVENKIVIYFKNGCFGILHSCYRGGIQDFFSEIICKIYHLS